MLSLYELKKILNPKQDSTPEDDFRIIQSWAEYDEKSSKPPEERNLKYLCYELEVMNPDTGEITHFYKAIKFARVIRLPANAKQSTAFMDMQEQILAGVHERNYNMITIIANVIKPVALGLLYLYGIQGVAESLEKAKEKAYYDFKGFVGMLQGTFRVLEIKCVEAQETEWLREKMYNMDYMTVVRGIPKANKAGEDAGNRGMGGSNLNPDSQGTLEEMITGMADYEYVIEVLSTPVYLDTLTGWQRQSQKEMTAWYSQLQGTKSLSMNLSNLSHSQNVGYDYIVHGLNRRAMKATVYAKEKEPWKLNAAEGNIDLFFMLLKNLRGKKPSDFLRSLYSIGKYKKYLEDYADFRNMEVRDLSSIWKEYQHDASTYNDWVEWGKYIVKYNKELKETLKNKDGIMLSTMHGSKGLEWKHVFIIDCVEGVCPSPKAETAEELEEERRLFYVAMTRAKEHLYLCYYKAEEGKTVVASPYIM